MSQQQSQGLDNYASPILRAAVFRRLYPGAQVSYSIIPIGQAFPPGHTNYDGKATEAVRCEIVLADGTYVVAHKEIDKFDVSKYKTVERTQTPEELAKDETKALGRALRDLGIPQRLTELKLLMQWIASMTGQPVQPSPAGAVGGAPSPEESFDGDDDSADAGAEDPTPEQVLARQFAQLTGASKAAVSTYAREAFGVSNVMRAGEHAEDLLAYVDRKEWLASVGVESPSQEEEPF